MQDLFLTKKNTRAYTCLKQLYGNLFGLLRNSGNFVGHNWPVDTTFSQLSWWYNMATIVLMMVQLALIINTSPSVFGHFCNHADHLVSFSWFLMGSKPNKSWKVGAHLQQTSCLSGSWGRGSLGGREFVEILKAYFGVYRKKIKFRKQLNSNLRDRAVYAAAYTFYLGNISFATLIKVQTHTRVCGSNKLTGQCTRNKLTKRLTVTVLNKSNELLKYVCGSLIQSNTSYDVGVA